MLQRISSVDKINVDIVSYSSVIQLGDSQIINSLSRALAVQREAEIYIGNEGNYANYSVYSESIPLPPITEAVSYRAHNLNPVIRTKRIRVIGFSSASMLHVGNSGNVSLEARIMHIRQLLPKNTE